MDDPYVPILMYHSISSSANPLFNRWAVPPALFGEHLEYLRQQQYTPITVTDLVRARASGGASLPARPVVLTFDDAYADFYENAFPRLQRQGFTATLYIPTAYVGGACDWLQHEGETTRPMASWSQLTEVSAGGIECGGHSHNHVPMDTIPPTAVEVETRRCKSILEEHLGREILSFAYPHGWTTSAVKRMVRAAGYTSACAVKNMPSSPADDPLELPRLVVTGDMDVEAFARLLTWHPSRVEVTLRNVARPIWRFVPRQSARRQRIEPEAHPAAASPASSVGVRDDISPAQTTPAQTDDTSFEPAAMLEVEIGQPFTLDVPVHPETGGAYRRILILVRLHTRPLGFIDWSPGDADGSADLLARRIWQTLGPQINAHLRDDGLPTVTRLGPEGLTAAGGTPPCLVAREAFLANAPFVSVVIPTHDRPQQVAALVQSILASEYPLNCYEIIVVDNAPSADATAHIINERFGSAAQVRYVREDRAGSSNARNRGLALARGEIVVFADDDELVDAHWLIEMVRGFDGPVKVACVTGLVVPMESETAAQGWFEQFGGYCKQQCTRRFFNLTDHREESPLYPYNVGTYGAGGSMAFRRSILQGIGGFDPALGPATPTLGGEDVDALLRIVLEGHTLLYEPAAIVRHPPHREYARLRRQIQGYGTGVASCLFKTLVTRPRLLPGFIGKLPGGLRFTLSARSPHHAGKRSDYPRELTWLEFKGLVYGPLAYLRSRRRVARIAPLDALSAHSEPEPQPVTFGEAS